MAGVAKFNYAISFPFFTWTSWKQSKVHGSKEVLGHNRQMVSLAGKENLSIRVPGESGVSSLLQIIFLLQLKTPLPFSF